MSHVTCGKRVVDVVEGDGVDWVNLLNVVLLEPVTLEGVLLLLNLRARVQVFHGHSAFDGAQHVTLPREHRPGMAKPAFQRARQVPDSTHKDDHSRNERTGLHGQTGCLYK